MPTSTVSKSNKIFRLDKKSQKLHWEKLPNGTYRANMVLGVADMPLEYVDYKGEKHTETITADELFNEDSLASAYGLPICLSHPKNGTYASNAEGLLVGHTLESFLNQDGQLLMPTVIDDHRGIKLIDEMIEKGVYAEVSPGYWVTRLQKDSKKYNQIGRRYDHIALLEAGEGRGGQNVVLRTDSKLNIDMAVSTDLRTCVEQVQTSYEDDETTVQKNCVETSVNTYESEYGIHTEETEKTTQTIMKYSWKEKEYTELSALATDANLLLDAKDKEIEKLRQDSQTVSNQLVDAKKTIAEDKKALETANGRLDALQIQLDSNKDLITLDAANARVAESIALWQQVEPIFKQDNAEFEPDYSLSPTEIKQLYIQQHQPKINLDGKSDEYINAVWDTISVNLDTLLADKVRADAKSKVQSQLTQLQTVEVLNADSADSEDATAKALQARLDKMTTAHKR